MTDLDAWEQLGEYRDLAGHRIFTIDAPALGAEQHEPLLVLHGFPTASFDFHLVLDGLRAHRRVLPPRLPRVRASRPSPTSRTRSPVQADIVTAFTAELGLRELALVTHDMGDTVGGELLARNVDGELARRHHAAGPHQRQHLHRDGAPVRRPGAPSRPARRAPRAGAHRRGDGRRRCRRHVQPALDGERRGARRARAARHS